MATNNLITTNGRNIMLNRAFKSVPDYTAPSQFKVGTGTTTPSIGDTNLTTTVAINGGNSKNITTITIDETNMMVTTISNLATTEPATQPVSLTEFGIVNTDGTSLLWSRSVHTAIAKTSSDALIYIQKDWLL